MKNKTLIIAVVIVAGCLVLAVVLFLKNKQKTAIPTEPTITVSTENPKINVPVKNYYTEPSATVIDEKDVLMETNEDFDILAYHYNNERSFLIYLKQSNTPIETVRQNAESAFVEKLGITKEQACLLVVSLSLAEDIEGSTTDNYGLSFCPNSKPLP